MNTLDSRRSSLRSIALLAALTLGGVVTTSTAWAATASAQTQPTASDNVLNGGIGMDSQKLMREEAHKWPLRMTFSEGSAGAFVADVALKIQDRNGHTVLDVKDAGPMTYVRIPHGEYRISASYKGKTLNRTVNIGAKGANAFFHW